MALFFADLVREACWATGAGALALDGALPGHRTFAETVPGGARFHYAICGVTHPEEWETGEGEITGGALARTPVASSAGGAAVAFSAGLKTVALTANAAWFEGQEEGVEIADVEGLTEALAGKAAAEHGHSFGSLSGRPTTLGGYGITDAAAVGHNHDGAYQPADAELSAIAGLTTTAFGRAQLELADAPAARANLGLGSAAVKAVGTSGDAVPLLNGGATSWAAGATFGGSLMAGTQIAADDAAQSLLNLFIGGASDVQIVATGSHTVTSYADTHHWKNWASAPLMTLSAGALSLGGSQVIAARRTGWTAPSGTAARSGFDTASVTTAALAERVKALIDDLIAHGLIGS